MKYTSIFLIAALGISCSGRTDRNPTVVAAEERERRKPLMAPPGGTYYKGIDVQILNYSPGWEYSTGAAFTLLKADSLALTATTTVTVRDTNDHALAATEVYTLVNTFPPLKIYPPPGIFTHPVTVALESTVQNSRVEVAMGEEFFPYDAETGIAVSETQTLRVRQCSGSECTAGEELHYTINPPLTIPSPRNLDAAEIAGFATRATQRYSQTSADGLAALMDEAKLRVLQNAALMPQPAMRQRFLAQDNITTAAEACTIVARYLYSEARRMSLGDSELPEFPDFPLYYIRHIVAGNITVDSGGRNFVWLVSGPALVTPYLPANAIQAFDFSRSAAFPTDFSLIDRLYVRAPALTLLRDGHSATSHTHTFIAIKAAAGYTMIDTYFAAFTGGELKASAGKSWPYAYRFGPAGSRYLHFVYGY